MGKDDLLLEPIESAKERMNKTAITIGSKRKKKKKKEK